MKRILEENVNYFYLNPELDDEIGLDSNDNKSVLKMLTVARNHLKKNEHLIQRIVDYLK